MNQSKNNLILKYGIIFLILIFIANISYYSYLVLDEPVFLKHYIALDMNEDFYMKIHLITNKNDTREIRQIEFPQLPEKYAYTTISDFSNNNDGFDRIIKHAHYSYKAIFIQVKYNESENDGNEETIILDKAIINYVNGDKQEVDIGKIVFHKNMNTNSFTDNFYSSSSNNFTSETKLRASKDFVIENIESNLIEETKGFLNIAMNDVKIEDLEYPITVKSGKSISFKSMFDYNSDDLRKYNVYDVKNKVIVKDSEGNIGNELLYNINYEPIDIFLNEKGIIDYLKVIGVK